MTRVVSAVVWAFLLLACGGATTIVQPGSAARGGVGYGRSVHDKGGLSTGTKYLAVAVAAMSPREVAPRGDVFWRTERGGKVVQYCSAPQAPATCQDVPFLDGHSTAESLSVKVIYPITGHSGGGPPPTTRDRSIWVKQFLWVFRCAVEDTGRPACRAAKWNGNPVAGFGLVPFVLRTPDGLLDVAWSDILRCVGHRGRAGADCVQATLMAPTGPGITAD